MFDLESLKENMREKNRKENVKKIKNKFKINKLLLYAISNFFSFI